MTDRTLDRAGAASGILHVVVALLGFFIHGYPAIAASPQRLVDWASATSTTRFEVGVYVEALGYLLFIPFTAWLYSLFRQTGRATDWVLATGFGAGLAYVVMTMPINEVWTAMLHGGKRGLDPIAMAALRDTAQFTFEATFVFAGLFMAATAFLLFQTRLLPGWLRWSALVIAVGIFIPSISVMVGFMAIFWILVLSVYMLVRPSGWRASLASRRPAASAGPGAAL